MTYEQGIKYFKSKKAWAQAIDVETMVVTNWEIRGVSKAGQLKTQIATNGKLKADV